MLHRPRNRSSAFLAAILLLVLATQLASAELGAAAVSSSPLTGGITGPSYVGINLTGSYRVTANGGPAEASNGTVVGIYSYRASVAASNTTHAAITPISGVLVNRSVNLSFAAPPVTEIVLIHVEVTSSFNKTNASENLTFSVNIVQPYKLTATLYSTSSESLNAFNLTVSLDGGAVGQIKVPSILAKSSVPVTFNYVAAGLSPGWHTFGLNVAPEHGLVVFANGAEQLTVSFYISGPAPDYTLWYVTGAVAFFGAIFIWLTRVAARRRGRIKK